jgi:hypothetical protein
MNLKSKKRVIVLLISDVALKKHNIDSVMLALIETVITYDLSSITMKFNDNGIQRYDRSKYDQHSSC